MIRMLSGSDSTLGLQWFWAFIPPISLEQTLSIIIINIGYVKKNLKYYWHYRYSMPFLVMQWVGVIIYGLNLTFIEINRIEIQRKITKQNFSNYSEYFKQTKRRCYLTDEAKEMEDIVHKNDD